MGIGQSLLWEVPLYRSYKYMHIIIGERLVDIRHNCAENVLNLQIIFI